ncbi:MAG: hypothetical protein IJY20_02225 [Clostridia bacterium]|nr:hypothetical protein [Clostridia bacterium]
MKKLVFVINGRGGVGKDTLCDFAARAFSVKNVSSITPVKELAAQVGWQGEKTDRARRFLSDLKALLVDYNDYPTVWATEQYHAFLASDAQIMFLHIREGKEIDKFVRATAGQAKTLLIRRAAVHQEAYGNRSDDEVENYTYDYIFDNDLPLEEAEGAFVSYLRGILEEIKE